MTTPTIDALIKRLQVHAQGSERADDPKNLADYIWLLKHQSVASGTDDIWNRLLQDIEDLNVVFNANSNSTLGRSLAYVINELITRCLDFAAFQPCDERIRNEMLQLAWRICVAWDAVLAGDIERIGEHIDLEERCRTL